MRCWVYKYIHFKTFPFPLLISLSASLPSLSVPSIVFTICVRLTKTQNETTFRNKQNNFRFPPYCVRVTGNNPFQSPTCTSVYGNPSESQIKGMEHWDFFHNRFFKTSFQQVTPTIYHFLRESGKTQPANLIYCSPSDGLKKYSDIFFLWVNPAWKLLLELATLPLSCH